MTDSERKHAQIWDNPRILNDVEQNRYPYGRAIGKLVEDAFRRHIQPGALVFEAGAGLGYLKTLVPSEYQAQYFTSDYSVANLRAGKQRRSLKAVAASAYELPLKDSSVEAVVNMDAYDTLPNLDRALEEALRVLKPDGTFMHFQVNFPSDDTVEFDYPNLIFFPAKYDEIYRRFAMVGVSREDLIKGLELVKVPAYRNLIADYMADPQRGFVQVTSYSQPWKITDVIYDILDGMPIDKLVIPSLPEYFRSKLEHSATRAGLSVVESNFKGTSVIADRTDLQQRSPQRNQFGIEQGSTLHNTNTSLKLSGSQQIVEKASILIFAAKK